LNIGDMFMASYVSSINIFYAGTLIQVHVKRTKRIFLNEITFSLKVNALNLARYRLLDLFLTFRTCFAEPKGQK